MSYRYNRQEIEAAVDDEEWELRIASAADWEKEEWEHREKPRRQLIAERATGDEKLAAISDYLELLLPTEKLGALLPLIKHEAPDLFWPAFSAHWINCDYTWDWRNRLLTTLHRIGRCLPSHYAKLCKDCAEFYHSLPDHITVCRGAGSARIRGLSWTTNRLRALHFAYGQRFDRNVNPVVATGVIEKSDVLFATNQRNEYEILGEPRIIKVEKFRLEELERAALEQAAFLSLDA
jgi:hypothetical protein